MITFELDGDNNIVIDNGSISLLQDEYATAQDLARELNLVKGENLLNTDDGLDWDNEILGKMGGIDYITSQVRNRILENEEVVNIVSMSTTRDGDTLDITTQINSIYGVITV